MNRRQLLAGLPLLFSSVPGKSMASEAKLPLEALRLPDTLVTSHEGTSYNFPSAFSTGRVVIGFHFTGCLQVCPVSNAVLAGLDVSLKAQEFADVRILSLTIDPLTDTPDILLQKANELGSSKRWLWLTGEIDAIDRLNQSLGISFGPEQNHSSFLLLGSLGNMQFVRISLEPQIPSTDDLLASLRFVNEPSG